MGAVSADLLYVSAMSLGAAAIVAALPGWGRGVMFVIGGIILFMLGLTALFAKSVGIDNESTSSSPKIRQKLETTSQNESMVRGYFLGFVLTLTSPSTLAYWAFISVSTARHAAEAGGPITVPLAAGVATACTLWVATASTIAGLFHRRLSPATYVIVERAAGAALCAFASVSII
jgi:threonine/homoserine/homoserine lactone efflux protein